MPKAVLPHTRFHSQKSLSPAQIKMLVALAAGEAVGHHEWRIIQALAYRGMVVGPKLDAFGRFLPLQLTALGRFEADKAIAVAR